MYDANVSMSAFTKVEVNATDSYVSDYFTTNNDTEQGMMNSSFFTNNGVGAPAADLSGYLGMGPEAEYFVSQVESADSIIENPIVSWGLVDAEHTTSSNFSQVVFWGVDPAGYTGDF